MSYIFRVRVSKSLSLSPSHLQYSYGLEIQPTTRNTHQEREELGFRSTDRSNGDAGWDRALAQPALDRSRLNSLLPTLQSALDFSDGFDLIFSFLF